MLMTNSDIIAIIAIVVSGITSISALAASFYINRANNKAKLTEIAFQKRMDVFAKIVELIADAEKERVNAIGLRNKFKEMMKELEYEDENKIAYSFDEDFDDDYYIEKQSSPDYYWHQDDVDIYDLTRLIQEFLGAVNVFYDKIRVLRDEYTKCRIFIPKSINIEINNYLNQYRLSEVLHHRNVSRITDDVLSKSPNTKVIPHMQKFIGLE